MYVYLYSKYASASAMLFLLVHTRDWKWLVAGSVPDFFIFYPSSVGHEVND